MPISSFPISVKSSINLSDINIDTDLNLGTNDLLTTTLIVNGNLYKPNKDLKFNTYPAPKTILNEPIEIFSYATAESNQFNYTTFKNYSVNTNFTVNPTLNNNISETYGNLIMGVGEFHSSGSTVMGSRLGVSNVFTNSLNNSFTTLSKTNSTSYIKSYLFPIRPVISETVISFQHIGISGATTGYLQNAKAYLIGYDYITNTYTDTLDLSIQTNINSFEKIILEKNDSIILNDTDTITNTETTPLCIYPTTNITKIQVIVGNPLITLNI